MAPLTHESFKHQLKNLSSAETRYLLAVSGGVDSMVLLNLFLKSEEKFEVAHVNYGLRAENSDKDQMLVEKVCGENGIICHIHQVHNHDKGAGSVQIWARNLRYRFFNELLSERKLDILVTAHHLNDQLETFLINLSRGTGIRGLTGIPNMENGVMRPLNTFTKEQILEYAAINKVEFRDDESNFKDDYLRNRIRHQIVPDLMNINPQFLQNFGKTVEKLGQVKDFLDDAANDIFAKISEEAGEVVSIDRKAFAAQKDLIQYEILRRFGFDSQEEIKKIMQADKGKVFQNKSYKLQVDRAQYVVSKTAELEKETFEMYHLNSQNEILIESFGEFPGHDYRSQTWLAEKSSVSFPLLLRSAEIGERFYPAGFHGSKTISKFIKDEKLPILAGQKIRILSDSDGQILGVIPLRQDRRFMAKQDSDEIFKIIF